MESVPKLHLDEQCGTRLRYADGSPRNKFQGRWWILRPSGMGCLASQGCLTSYKKCLAKHKLFRLGMQAAKQMKWCLVTCKLDKQMIFFFFFVLRSRKAMPLTVAKSD